MFTAEQTAPSPLAGLRLAYSRLYWIGPVAVVALVLALLLTSRLQTYHGNAAGFALFGQRYTQYTHPPRGAPLNSPIGYDGQFYWIEAGDPLLLKHSTVADMRGPAAGYHFQRPLYPALAYALALGRRSALPWTMLAVNVLAVLAITLALAVYCRRRGHSPWWALAVGLAPGLLMASLRDLTDPLAISAMVGGVVAWYANRRWWAAGLLSAAVLSRESMLAAVVAIGLAGAVECWRQRRRPGAGRAMAMRTWPAVTLPILAYAAWQVYIRLHVTAVRGGASVGAASRPSFAPSGLLGQLRDLLHGQGAAAGSWEAVYLALIAAGALAAIVLARRSVAAGLAALLFAGTLLVIPFGDQWGLTRYSAPVFAMLLVGGIEHRSRPALRIALAAAAMTAFLPWVIAGV